MATVVLDIVEGSEIDDSAPASTLKRVAYVYGLDVGAPTGDPSALLRSLTSSGMVQLFQPHPSNANYFCNRRVVIPETDSSCYVDLYYFRGAIQGSTWLQTEDTTTIPDTTQFHPGTGAQLTLALDIGTGSSAQTKTDIATLSYPRRVRRIMYEGTIIGFNIPGSAGNTPPSTLGGGQVANKDAYTAAINCVNNVPWKGYDIGYWWFSEWSVTTPDRGASNTVKAAFLSKMTEPWVQYAVLRDTNSGKLIKVDPTIVAALRQLPYVYDLQYVTTNGKNNGILRAGMFPLANFVPLFGT